MGPIKHGHGSLTLSAISRPSVVTSSPSFNTYHIMATLSELLQSCLTQFTSLISSTLCEHTDQIPLQDWKDELGRLHVWAANIGAHQTSLCHSITALGMRLILRAR